MDRSLWLLLMLRSRARVRQVFRGFRSLKGLLLALIGMLALVPLLLSTVINPRIQLGAQTTLIREYGPLFLLAYCLLNVVLSSGDRSIYYSLAEINVLFCAPYRPRQLLLYKIVVGAGTAFVSALFMTFLFAHHASSFLAAWVGLFLALELFGLFALCVGLVISMTGAVAFQRGRWVLLLIIGGCAVVALAPLGREALRTSPRELVADALASPLLSALSSPFRPFAMTFTASKIWPDLFRWSSLAALVDLGLVGLVLGLNARFLEIAATSASRRFEKGARDREAGIDSHGRRSRSMVPTLPWWGGIGPNAWRQLTSALRSPWRLLTPILLFVVPVSLALIAGGQAPGDPSGAVPALSVLLSVVLLGPSVVRFDFRDDLRRMEDLKTLPIRPSWLVLSQLLTPGLVLSLGQSLAVFTVAVSTRLSPSLTFACLAFCLPLNLVVLAIENLYFLLYPFRSTGLNSFDFQIIGRQILLTMARILTLGTIVGLASALAYLGYLLTGDSLPIALTIAWLVAVSCGTALIPLVALAFLRQDVTGPPPE